MSRIAYCEACAAIENGIKSRISFTHTCGLSYAEINAKIKEQTDNKNGCQACHFEMHNNKPARQPHTCGLKSVISADKTPL